MPDSKQATQGKQHRCDVVTRSAVTSQGEQQTSKDAIEGYLHWSGVRVRPAMQQRQLAMRRKERLRARNRQRKHRGLNQWKETSRPAKRGSIDT